MRLGTMIISEEWPDKTINAVVKFAKDMQAQGFDNLWMANIFGLDAINTLGVVGHATTSIGLGTAVVPSYPRHPVAMAQQALTTAAASSNRFTLGIGLSHKLVIEDMLGMSYDKPARHMREYLEILMPLLRGEAVDYKGEQYRSTCAIDVVGTTPVPVVVAALGPVMLKLAGQLADGTTTWMTGPDTLEDYIIPGISKAASDAGKAPPTVVAGLPIALCRDAGAARAKLDESLVIYGQLPSYRAMLDKEGAAGPGDIAMVGDEAGLRGQILRLRDMGVTDFNAAMLEVEPGAVERTAAFLAALKPELK